MFEDNEINFTDENGDLKPIEDILEDVSKIYDTVAKEVEKEKENEVPVSSFVKKILSNEGLQDTDKAYEAVDFIERCLYITTEITQEHSTTIFNAIKFWNLADEMDNTPIEKRIPIKIYIDTPGGDLYATLSIIDSITLSKTPVRTITIGTGDSGGFLIGISGHERIGFPNSTYLFHEGSCSFGGDAHKFVSHSEHYKTLLDKIKEIVLNKTKINDNEYDKIKKDDFWLTAKEALDYGIIDKIADNLLVY